MLAENVAMTTIPTKRKYCKSHAAGKSRVRGKRLLRGGTAAVPGNRSTREMEGKIYIRPSALNLMQNLPPQIRSSPPPHFVIGDQSAAAQHLLIQSFFMDNNYLEVLDVLLQQKISAVQNKLHHLCSVADEIKPERDVQVREIFDRAAKMDPEVKSIDELNEKLSKLRDHLPKLNRELNQIPMIKSEIEREKRELRRGRAAIKQEKKVHASNVKMEAEVKSIEELDEMLSELGDNIAKLNLKLNQIPMIKSETETKQNQKEIQRGSELGKKKVETLVSRKRGRVAAAVASLGLCCKFQG